MPSIQYYLLRLYLSRLQKKQANYSGNKVQLRRKLLDEVAGKFTIPKGIEIRRVSANAIPSEWISMEKRIPRGVILYLHGGAYVAGSLKSHRHLVANLAIETGYDVLNVDYRLAPEHTFPAAVADAYNAYQWLSHQENTKRIVVAGDSAGGGLATALLLKLQEEHETMPDGAVLLAPWVDLRRNIRYEKQQMQKDVILTDTALMESAALYAHQNDANVNPFISPILGSYEGFPPTMIQVGSYDLLWDEGRALAEHMKLAGVRVYLYDWPKMLHVWQFFVGRLPEARKALKEIKSFLDLLD